MADLELDSVTRSYDGRTHAVREVSFTVSDGEIVTVLGPSGCGKSTLLRLIAGLERCDAGEIRIGGEPMTGVSPRDRDVAMVFQSYALYPHMSVFENIAVSLRLRGIPAAEVRSRVGDTARSLDVERLLERRPRHLSGGERQRVALARALVRNPRVFLLDEPLSNLDALLREQARQELKQLFRRDRSTVIYVTHDQIEAMTLSDRVAIMNEGRVEQVGSPGEIYGKPATVFTAGFVGSPRMNLFAGAVIGDSATTVGVRPEQVEVAPLPDAGCGSVHGLDCDVRPSGKHADDARSVLTGSFMVSLREPLGLQHLLSLAAPDLDLRAMVPAEFPECESVRIRIRHGHIHRFDARGFRVG